MIYLSFSLDQNSCSKAQNPAACGCIRVSPVVFVGNYQFDSALLPDQTFYP